MPRLPEFLEPSLKVDVAAKKVVHQDADVDRRPIRSSKPVLSKQFFKFPVSTIPIIESIVKHLKGLSKGNRVLILRANPASAVALLIDWANPLDLVPAAGMTLGELVPRGSVHRRTTRRDTR